jgi:hypothetical protein
MNALTDTFPNGYAVVETREWYGPETTRSLVSDGRGRPMILMSRGGAKDLIRDYDNDRYHLAHNESDRPSYKAVKVESLPRYLRDMIW